MLLWGEREAEATSHFKQPVACEETLLQTAKIVSQSALSDLAFLYAT